MEGAAAKPDQFVPEANHIGVGDEQRSDTEEQSTVTREVEPDAAGKQSP